MTTRISVLLVDDHVLVRRGLRRLLEDDAAIHVVGEADDGETAVELAALLEPRVVVMDCCLPQTTGIAAVSRITEARPRVAVLMLSMYNEAHLVQQALDAGARGYVLKDASNVDLAESVKRVASGEMVLDPRVIPATRDRARRDKLSPRQLQVLQLMCEGLSQEAIARRLDLSVNTVAVHRAGIMKSLGVHSAGELVAYAIRHRLVHVH